MARCESAVTCTRRVDAISGIEFAEKGDFSAGTAPAPILRIRHGHRLPVVTVATYRGDVGIDEEVSDVAGVYRPRFDAAIGSLHGRSYAVFQQLGGQELLELRLRQRERLNSRLVEGRRLELKRLKWATAAATVGRSVRHDIRGRTFLLEGH